MQNTDRRLICIIHKEFLQINESDNPRDKWAKDKSREIIE